MSDVETGDQNLNNFEEDAEIIEEIVAAVEDSELGDTAAIEESVGEEDLALQEWQAKSNEYLEGWQRSRAEFANYKKRIEREQVFVYQSAAGNILKKQLVVLDDLSRALSNRPDHGEGAAWSEGIELVYRKMVGILESEGLKMMQADGQMFDPNLHEAISSEENPDFESGQIIEVLQKGYFLGDRVLRPALVRVAR